MAQIPHRSETMRQQVVVTRVEYKRIQNLLKVVNNRTMSVPRRKIARAQYESMIRFFKSRPAISRESSIIIGIHKDIG